MYMLLFLVLVVNSDCFKFTELHALLPAASSYVLLVLVIIQVQGHYLRYYPCDAVSVANLLSQMNQQKMGKAWEYSSCEVDMGWGEGGGRGAKCRT